MEEIFMRYILLALVALLCMPLIGMKRIAEQITPEKSQKPALITTVQYICMACTTTFANRALFIEHMQTHNAEQQKKTLYKCTYPHCRAAYDIEPSALNHIATHQYIGSKCPDCNHIYQSAKDIEQHTTMHNQDLTITCPYCKIKYPSEQKLNAHVTKYHTDIHECSLCTYTSPFFPNLKRHAISKHKVNLQELTCLKCNSKQSDKELLKIHTKDCTAIAQPKNALICPKCQQSYAYNLVLQKHMQTCTGHAKKKRKKVTAALIESPSLTYILPSAPVYLEHASTLENITDYDDIIIDDSLLTDTEKKS